MSEVVRRCLLVASLGVLIVASAIAAVSAKHESRKLFTELQALRVERDRMEVEWGQLRIEQSTWSTYARVEKLAREEMHMRSPATDELKLLDP